jgi:hypothetical protein
MSEISSLPGFGVFRNKNGRAVMTTEPAPHHQSRKELPSRLA